MECDLDSHPVAIHRSDQIVLKREQSGSSGAQVQVFNLLFPQIK